jgi:hypothetical protein
MKTKAMNESWILEKNYKMNRSDALKQGWLLAKNHNVSRKVPQFLGDAFQFLF